MQTPPLESRPARLPTFTRVFRWLVSWRLWRMLVLLVAVLATLTALSYAVSDWTGRRAWEACRTTLEARGVALALKPLIPPPVPDDENFAMTPFLAPLFDFNPPPLKEGQSRWRDTNGFNRANGFAQILPRDAGPGWAEGKRTGLGEFLGKLMKDKFVRLGTNSPVPDFAGDRKAAAVAVLTELREFNPVLEELRQASQRPFSRFNLVYDEENPWGILLPHLAVVKRTALVLSLRASAELALDRVDAAAQDAELILHLANSIKDEPFIIVDLVRVAMIKAGLQVIWEGLADHLWSDAQLQAFSARLNQVEILRSFERDLGSERACGNVIFERMRNGPNRNQIFDALPAEGGGAPQMEVGVLALAPRGWIYREQIVFNQLYDDYLLQGIEPAKGRVHPAVIEAKAKEIEAFLGKPGSALWHHCVLSRLLLPALARACQKTALGQAMADQALAACALERYRLVNARFPEKLDALVPQFLPKLPPDVCTGEPLKYRLSPKGTFVLYSAGWNEKDDGGVVALTAKDHHQDPLQGDWVWQYPENQ